MIINCLAAIGADSVSIYPIFVLSSADSNIYQGRKRGEFAHQQHIRFWHTDRATTTCWVQQHSAQLNIRRDDIRCMRQLRCVQPPNVLWPILPNIDKNSPNFREQFPLKLLKAWVKQDIQRRKLFFSFFFVSINNLNCWHMALFQSIQDAMFHRTLAFM